MPDSFLSSKRASLNAICSISFCPVDKSLYLYSIPSFCNMIVNLFLSLTVNLTLNCIFSNTELIIVADEGMSSLDKENLHHILEIFNNLPFQLIFVIHNLEEVPDGIQTIDLDKEEK